MTVAPLLIAETIGKSHGHRTLLTSAYLQATPGRITALVGGNGSGKSTLLHIAAGTVRADHGSIWFDGRLQSRPRLYRLARQGLFLLPADRSILSPGFTVDAHLKGVQRSNYLLAVPEVLEQLAIGDLMEAKVAALSGGERRRVELAIAMMRSSRCLLADDPLRGLAPLDAELVLRILRAMAGIGCAIVLTSYDLSPLVGFVDEVIWLNAGTTRVLGAVDRAADDWAFSREFLGKR